ncbi:MAG: DNA N-6-adenine-methyltransferase [Rhodopila sp.]|jgi:transcriptional regulator with XRE-family HTH domain
MPHAAAKNPQLLPAIQKSILDMKFETKLPRTRVAKIRAQNPPAKISKGAHLPCLGRAIRQARRDARKNQTELASSASLCRNAVVAVEGGRGHIATLTALADALNLEVAGRGLAGDGALGQRMLALRKRRRLSRRTAAMMAGISIPAVEGFERTGNCHVEVLEALGRAVGAGLCLVRKGTSPDFWAAAANSTGETEWYTPAWLLDLVVGVVGPIDTDPCSPGRGKSSVQARLHLTALDDGLAHGWPGVVWMNPPYGRTLSLWLEKARREVEVGNARCVTALVPARTDTTWWHCHISGVADIVLLRGRISFGDGTSAAPFPSALLGYGLSTEQRDALFRAFPDSMHVPAAKRVTGESVASLDYAAPGKPRRD